MPQMIPVQAVHIGRPHKSGRKNKDGDVIHETVRPTIGEPFEFTDEEVADIQAANPAALREPINEGGDPQQQQAQQADQAADRAAREAVSHRAAVADAARVARTGALGKGARKQPDNTDRGEVNEPDEPDEL